MTDIQKAEYLKLWQSSNPMKTAVTAGISRKVANAHHCRSLYWRIYFGILPMPSSKEDSGMAASWSGAMRNERQRFHTKKTNQTSAGGLRADIAPPKAKQKTGPRFGDDSSSDDDDVTEVTDDPLSSAPDSEWGKKFQMQKLFGIIDHDLNRLWGEVEFFEEETTRKNLREVLVTHTSDNHLSYRQGMHEVASVLYYWIVHDAEATAEALTGTDPADDDEVTAALRVVFDINSIIPDTFTMFERLMSEHHFNLNLVYDTSNSVCTGNDLGKGALTGASNTIVNNEGVELAHYVQVNMLKRHHDTLGKYLNNTLSISPQSYGIRWLRLLFLREFPLTQCSTIWDCLFCELAFHRSKGKPFDVTRSLLPSLAAAMLLYIADDLLERDDFAMVLQRLMKYPPVEGVDLLVEKAVKMTDNSELADIAGVSTTGTSKNAATAATSTQPGAGHAARGHPHHPPAPLAGGLQSPGLKVLETAEQLREKQLRMGMILNSVVERMERKWFPAPSGDAGGISGSTAATAQDEEDIDNDYIMAIAELKKVKDVLLNTIPE